MHILRGRVVSQADACTFFQLNLFHFQKLNQIKYISCFWSTYAPHSKTLAKNILIKILTVQRTDCSARALPARKSIANYYVCTLSFPTRVIDHSWQTHFTTSPTPNVIMFASFYPRCVLPTTRNGRFSLRGKRRRSMEFEFSNVDYFCEYQIILLFIASYSPNVATRYVSKTCQHPTRLYGILLNSSTLAISESQILFN